MHTQPGTVTNPSDQNYYRTTARIVGVLYLAGMVVGIGGKILIQSILTAPMVCPRSPRAACCWPSGSCVGWPRSPVTPRHTES